MDGTLTGHVEAPRSLEDVNAAVGASFGIERDPLPCFYVRGVAVLPLTVVLPAGIAFVPGGLVLEAHLISAGVALDAVVVALVDLAIFTGGLAAPAEVGKLGYGLEED